MAIEKTNSSSTIIPLTTTTTSSTTTTTTIAPECCRKVVANVETFLKYAEAVGLTQSPTT